MKTLTQWIFKRQVAFWERFKAPTQHQLAALLDRVISEWCNLSTVPAGRPVEGPAQLSLEYSVKLQGPRHCHLVLRGSWELAAELAYAATGDPGARSEGEDAFRELCSQVAGRLICEALPEGPASYHSQLPQPSQPRHWPLRHPDSESVILVGYRPLEARLWIDDAPLGQGA